MRDQGFLRRANATYAIIRRWDEAEFAYVDWFNAWRPAVSDETAMAEHDDPPTRLQPWGLTIVGGVRHE